MPFLIRFFVFASVALIVGLGSAAFFLDRGFFATAKQVGPWRVWVNSGALDADPYTLARVARSGGLPITSASLLSFSATEDSDGSPLSGDCTYDVVGRPFPSLWWNLAAFTETGQPIANPAGRHAFNNANLLVSADGLFIVRVAPEVQPGNWLPTASGESFILMLNILRPLNRDRVMGSPTGENFMPRIVKVTC